MEQQGTLLLQLDHIGPSILRGDAGHPAPTA
jgi:hypothetical protein